jgi:hypothetical protein
MRQARVLRRGSITLPACRARACRPTPDAQKLSISVFRRDNRHGNNRGLFPLLARRVGSQRLKISVALGIKRTCAEQHPRQKESPSGYGDPGGQDEIYGSSQSCQRTLQCAPRGVRSPRGDHHFLGFLDWPQPRRSSDAAGVPVDSSHDRCPYSIGESVLPDQFG